MKNLQFMLLSLFLILASCSTTKVERTSQKELKGDWVLNQILNDQGTSVNVTNLFGNGTIECFQGSVWHLVANNNSGNYQFQNSNCDATPTNIKWYVEEDGGNNYFMFKQVGENDKAKNVNAGYRMQIISVDDMQAHLMHEVPFENQKLAIHFYFNKQ